jgi:hypothetical protein
MTQFLVTTDHVTPQGGIPTEMIEEVIGDLHTLVGLTNEGTILAGGGLAGRRQHAFIIEADSAIEVVDVVQDLSLWAQHEFRITPIESYEHHIEHLERLKAKLTA